MYNIHAYVLPCNERNIPVCCKFTQLHSHQILLKSVNISYCEKQKGELFLKHSVYIYALWLVSSIGLQAVINRLALKFTGSVVDSADLIRDDVKTMMRQAMDLCVCGETTMTKTVLRCRQTFKR